MKKAVLFDFHNTLATCSGWLDLEIKTLPALTLARLAARGVVSLEGRDPSEEATRRFHELRSEARASGVEVSAAEGAKQVLNSMGYHPPDSDIERAVEELERACLPEVMMMPGAAEVLAKLRSDGYRLGVVSSAGYPPFVELALEKLGLLRYFDEILTSAGEGIYKSDPEIFRRAARRLGVEPEEAVHIGDHAQYDVAVAKAAGLSAIWFVAEARRTVEAHGTPWEEVAQAGEGADAVAETMEEVYEAIKRLA